MPFRFLKRRLMTTARFAWFWSTRNNHGLAQERRVCVLTPRSFRKLPRPFRSFPELPEASGNLPEASGSFPEELYKASDFNELNARRRATSAARRRATSESTAWQNSTRPSLALAHTPTSSPASTPVRQVITKLSLFRSQNFAPLFSDWVYETSVPHLQISPYLQIYKSVS